MSDEKTFSVAEVEMMKSEWQMQAKDARIAELEARVAAPAQQDPVTPPAAAPRAPSAVPSHEANGLVNIFALPDQTIAQMTPAQMRGHLEKILDYHIETSGRPKIPTPPKRGQ